ncbi:group III truncated hemoglobin [Robiginitomaculum antarcticum]|uniref:group III truncated hemoglobin n=1 Tax=Robiginitomaculum antarcticum TaxID=437507 RepID=UPI00036CA8CA|nr:group III truncated hemoglobin [Robiginitomaculum antarcticum]
MTDLRVTSAREDTRKNAEDMGIDEVYIDRLVETFYGRIRDHEVLGPVFNTAIKGEDWPHHLGRMKAFWASVTLNAGLYSGKPVPAHQKHADTIQDWHFGIWLGLFRQTLVDTAPTQDAVEYFMVRAERIASSLKLAIFGMPGLGRPKYGK